MFTIKPNLEELKIYIEKEILKKFSDEIFYGIIKIKGNKKDGYYIETWYGNATSMEELDILIDIIIKEYIARREEEEKKQQEQEEKWEKRQEEEEKEIERLAIYYKKNGIMPETNKYQDLSEYITKVEKQAWLRAGRLTNIDTTVNELLSINIFSFYFIEKWENNRPIKALYVVSDLSDEEIIEKLNLKRQNIEENVKNKQQALFNELELNYNDYQEVSISELAGHIELDDNEQPDDESLFYNSYWYLKTEDRSMKSEYLESEDYINDYNRVYNELLYKKQLNWIKQNKKIVYCKKAYFDKKTGRIETTKNDRFYIAKEG